MQVENVIHEIRQKLQAIQSTQELATLRLLSQLEAMASCPLEKDCPRIGKKGHA